MKSPPFTVVAAVSRTPPITGQGIAGDMLIEALDERRIPTIVLPLSREHRVVMNPVQKLRRSLALANIYRDLRRIEPPTDHAVFYLHLGQSRRAFLRDIALLHGARQRDIPQVVHVHGGSFRLAFDDAVPALQAIIRRTLGQVHRVIVLSEGLRPMFDGIVPEDRISIVPNGIDDALWQGSPGGRDRKPHESLHVLYMASLLPKKGYLVVLETARLAARSNLPIVFTIAGERLDHRDPDPGEFVAAHELPNVKIVGTLTGDDKRRAFEQAHVVVLPSLYTEGQPLTILEAMHFGLPVIATNVGGVSEDVVTGETGILIPTADPSLLLPALRDLLDDELWRRQLGRLGLVRARQSYTRKTSTNSVISILADAAMLPLKMGALASSIE